MARSAVTGTSVGDIWSRQRDFERSQRAARRSPRTIQTYREGIDQLAALLGRQGMPLQVASIRREHVEAFMDELNARTKPSTASNPVPGPAAVLQVPRRGGRDRPLADERMRRPVVPVEPVPVR